MNRKQCALSILRDAVFCTIFGPALAGLVYGGYMVIVEFGSYPAIHAVLKSPYGLRVIVASAVSTPFMAMTFAVPIAGPFGFVFGALLGWWQFGRAASAIATRRLYWESAGVGALLGATYPYSMQALFHNGWNAASSGTLGFLALGAAVGVACALALAWLKRRTARSTADSPGT